MTEPTTPNAPADTAGAFRRARGNTPVRNVRLDDVTWGRVLKYAESHGCTASDVFREALDRLI